MSVRLGPYINAVVPRVVLRQATRLVVGLGRELHEALVHAHPIQKRRRQLVRVLLHDEVAGGWDRYERCHGHSLQSDGPAVLFNAAHPRARSVKGRIAYGFRHQRHRRLLRGRRRGSAPRVDDKTLRANGRRSPRLPR